MGLAGVSAVEVNDFAGFRAAARALIVRRVPPESVQWLDAAGDLLACAPPACAEPPPEGARAGSAGKSENSATLRVSRELMDLLASAACYRAADRWPFLYRVLWRWHHGEKEVMSMADPDGNRLHRMAKAVRHEEHDMHAYLRFRERPPGQGAPRFIAWFEPAHDVLPQVAEHFAHRMGNISWMIATPDATVMWDGRQLHSTGPLMHGPEEIEDSGETLWLTYYRSIFNPARLNADIMHGHIRSRFWKNLPEAAVVPHMITQAAAGARKVGQLEAVTRRKGSTIPITPQEAQPERQQPSTLDECRRCDLWQNATQAVAGQGSRRARIMLVGEQPGDQEDLAGKPFVGPAGELLDRAMDAADLDRRTVYVTNAVKHFKWEPRGKRRMHKTPAQKEVAACHYWLEAELESVGPDVIVALGATALKSVLQSGSVSLKDYMEQPVERDGRWIIAAYHPAFALRVPSHEERQRAFETITEALRQAKKLAGGRAGG